MATFRFLDEVIVHGRIRPGVWGRIRIAAELLLGAPVCIRTAVPVAVHEEHVEALPGTTDLIPVIDRMAEYHEPPGDDEPRASTAPWGRA